MKKTENYAMPYPEQDDYFNVEDFQDMMVSVDNLMKKISDSGSQISSDAEHLYNQTKAQMDNIQKRMNTFTSLKDGSTTGDAELKDIRVAYDGKEYGNAGEAVREQASDIHKALFGNGVSIWSKTMSQSTKYVTAKRGIFILNEPFVADGVITKINRGTFRLNETKLGLDKVSTAYIVKFENTSGTMNVPSLENLKGVSACSIKFEEDGNAHCWIPVEKGQYLAVTSTVTAYETEDSKVPYMFWNQEQKTMEYCGFTPASSTQPAEPHSLAVEYKLEYDMDDAGLVKQVAANRETAALLKEDMDNLNELDFSKVLTIKDEYVNQNGVIEPYKTWARTDYMEVPHGYILKIKTPNLDSIYDSVYNAFYDKDRKFISWFKTVMNKENRILIPYGAAYYILSGEYKDLMTQIEVPKKITLNVKENSDRILNNGIFVNKSLYTHFTRVGKNKYIFREFKRYAVNNILDLYRMYIGHIENNSPVEDEKIGTSSSDVIGPVSICNTLTGTYSWSGGVHGIKIGETTYPTAENVSVKLFCDGKEITNDGFYIGTVRIIAENDLYFPQTITGYDKTNATKAIREKRVYTLTNKMNVKVFLSTYNDCYINYYYGCQCLTYDMTDIYLPNNELHTSYSEISDYLLFNKREQKYYCSKDNRHYDVEVCPFGLGSYYLNDGSNPSYKFGNIASFRKIYHQFIANKTKIENNKCLMWEADYDYYID